MPPRRYSLTATREHQGMRLDQALSAWLPEAASAPISKGGVRKLIVAGAVYLNGTRVRIASKELRAGARIDVYLDLQKLQGSQGTARDKPFEMAAAHVLYEDEWLIAVDKPPGLPTQPTLDEARLNLFAAVKKFLAARDGVAQPYVGLHHRLDRDTSGVVLFTKAASANAGVARLFAEHEAKKTYQALARLPGLEPEAEWVVKNYLAKAPGGGKRARFTAVRSGGDYAETAFRLLERTRGGLWIEARPKTGRTHQIRVHLAEGGMPILGDLTYGPESPRSGAGPAPRLMLHAARLEFPHPVNHARITVESPLPEDFTRCLKLLRSAGGAS